MAETCPHCGKPISHTALKIGGPQGVLCPQEKKELPARQEFKQVKPDRGDLVRQGLPRIKTLD